ncbi:hypothetical protein N7931_05790 [Catenovulum sp. 2E275]|uniref:hypothetical protein n=1 Tax=Catenovulum sp. 2E275 TaxID=2980497 RepID=UPI0021D36241|nr:hypothetical protein [Catenovulum sp. 2E275]MCU4675141.1 hypothetical protein [Catenovulum sp. 2E275]
MTTFKSCIKPIIFSAVLCSNLVVAGQAEVQKIEDATATVNVGQLQKMVNTLTGYDLALAQYRLALSANVTGQTELANNTIEQAINTLEALDKKSPDNVEIKALLAQVYGYKISIEPQKAAYYGPKAGEKLAQAQALAPDNPRVLLVQGISKYTTPVMFGGDINAALSLFERAAQAYASEQNLTYQWGYAEAYTWQGLVNQQLGNTEQAKQNWQQALAVDADYGWAKSLLGQAE